MMESTRGLTVYRLVNTETGVCEAEGFSLRQAILYCVLYDRELESLLLDPEAALDLERAVGVPAPEGAVH